MDYVSFSLSEKVGFFKKCMKKKYYHYSLWEDFNNGFFDKIAKNEDLLIDECKNILSNQSLFLEKGLDMINAWVISASENLTNNEINKKAWIGQATCCFCVKAPSFITRMAWNELTIEQQRKANAIAEKIINYFINKTNKNHVKTLFDE